MKQELQQALQYTEPTMLRPGVYLIQNQKSLAIFKPGVIREYLAFALDHERFAGVPKTTWISLSHPLWKGTQQGSCQVFVEGGCFLDTLPQEKWDPLSLRRLALFDIRLLNIDRHLLNVIYCQGKLVPIDHTLILQEGQWSAHLFWYGTSQAMVHVTPEELAYLQGIDIEKDVHLMTQILHLPMLVARRYVIAHYFLLEGLHRSWKVGEIGGCLVQRRGEEQALWMTWSQCFTDYMASAWPVFIQQVQGEVERFYEEVTCV